MSSIVKQSNGRFKARFRDPNGRSRSMTFDLERDARRFLTSTGTDINHGEFIDPAARRATFDEIADLWWSTTAKLRPTTRRGYRGLLERHVLPYFGGRKVGSIDYNDVEQFIATLLSAGLSPKYVREATTVVSLIMRTAVRGNLRRDNPAANHEIPCRRRRMREGDMLSMEQVHRLVANTAEAYRPAVWMLALTGMRPAELAGLRIRDIDFPRRLVHVRGTLQYVHKFADVAYQRVEGPTKTGASDRTIPIPEWLCDELAAMLATRESKESASFLFLSPKGHPLNRDKFRQAVIRPALRAAGLPEEFRTYDLRHAHASLLIDLGANVLAVAQRMGHSDPSITLRTYGHLLEGTQAKLSAQLDELRSSTANAARLGEIVDLEAHRESRP